VVVVDHFGKMMESGTRGSSNKEGNADAISATLTRNSMAPFQIPGWPCASSATDAPGFEIPFTPQVVELGLDEDGDPITAMVLDWGNSRMTVHPFRKSKDLTLLSTVLAEISPKKGFPFLPEPEAWHVESAGTTACPAASDPVPIENVANVLNGADLHHLVERQRDAELLLDGRDERDVLERIPFRDVLA
jgi:hypothetical protein